MRHSRFRHTLGVVSGHIAYWLVGLALGLGLALTVSGAHAFDCSAAEREVIALTNADRTSNGVASLQPRDDLATIARARSYDMAERNYFSHAMPPDGSYFESLLDLAGIAYSQAGENIARNNYPDNETARRAYTGFMNSGSHRANILDPAYREIGVGVWFRPDGMTYYTVLFVRPADASMAEASAGNRSLLNGRQQEDAAGVSVARARPAPDLRGLVPVSSVAGRAIGHSVTEMAWATPQSAPALVLSQVERHNLTSAC